MRSFKSNIENCYYLPGLHACVLLVLLIGKVFLFNWWILIAILIYLAIWYLVLKLSDNSVHVSESEIQIERQNSTFFRRQVVKKNEAKFIEFKYNWIDWILFRSRHLWLLGIIFVFILPLIFPAFYKVIIIQYKNRERKRFYCFGIPEDYYTNYYEDTFENLIRTFYQCGYNLKITDKVKDTISSSVDNK
jgi:hypothetical protein